MNRMQIRLDQIKEPARLIGGDGGDLLALISGVLVAALFAAIFVL
jgi:hypothetical protein